MKLASTISVLMLAAASSQAALFTFTASLDGTQETPPNASLAQGTVTAVLDGDTGQFSLAGSFQGLSSPSTASHVHVGLPGVAGPVHIPLTVIPLGGTSGIVFGSVNGLTAPEENDLINARWYVNIHDTAFPGGEIRGQLHLVTVPEPATYAAFAGVGLLGFAAWRRFRA